MIGMLFEDETSVNPKLNIHRLRLSLRLLNQRSELYNQPNFHTPFSDNACINHKDHLRCN